MFNKFLGRKDSPPKVMVQNSKSKNIIILINAIGLIFIEAN
jgi:hypothetical protein